MDRTTSRTPADRQDDDALVRRILGGEVELFRQLATRHGERVLRFVGRLLLQYEDAEEVTQDTLAEAYQSLSRFDQRRGRFSTWLMRIAYNTALKRYRQQQKSVPMTEVEPQWLEAIADEEVDALLDDADAHRLTHLEHAISMLKPDDQMLLSLYYYDNLSIRDVSDITSRDEGYLRSRLQWIRKKLANLIITLERNETA